VGDDLALASVISAVASVEETTVLGGDEGIVLRRGKREG
jgi:hypothetical protein